MSNPWRKVIYFRLKPDTKAVAFILLECGHVHYCGYVKKIPKRKHCCYCTWGVKTIDLIFWDFDKIRWRFVNNPASIQEFLERTNIFNLFLEKNNES